MVKEKKKPANKTNKKKIKKTKKLNNIFKDGDDITFDACLEKAITDHDFYGSYIDEKKHIRIYILLEYIFLLFLIVIFSPVVIVLLVFSVLYFVIRDFINSFSSNNCREIQDERK